MGQTVSTGIDNDELIDNLVEADYIKNPKIQRIFRAVDRANYFLAGQKADAYRDSAWRVGNLHLSAPCVYSGVMESLELRRGLSFLNLGSGCGYLSTMAGLILGPYGINHGVEIYKDVVDYSYDRLDDFMKESDAVDEYDFCEPTFVNGNCLKIDSLQLYDRVYCGAACPLEHETYMKHLIKVGGILVIPLNNKLLQITRTSEATWESSMILSVSFAPLISPSETECMSFVKLPDFCPPSLQVLCRSKIRTILKSRIDEEQPNLQAKKRERCRTTRSHISQVVIPLVNENDVNDRNTGVDLVDFTMPPSTFSVRTCLPTRTTAFIKSFLHATTEIQAVVAGPSNWNNVHNDSPSSSKSSSSTAPTEASAEKNEKQAKKDKEKDDDSDSYCDISTDEDEDDNKCQMSDSEFVNDAPLSNKNKESLMKGSSPQQGKKLFKTELITMKRCDSSSETQVARCRKRSYNDAFGAKSNLKKSTDTRDSIIFRRILQMAAPELLRTAKRKKAQPVSRIPEKDLMNYKNLMAKKILSLPLPMPVKMFINYKRNNFKFFIN